MHTHVCRVELSTYVVTCGLFVQLEAVLGESDGVLLRSGVVHAHVDVDVRVLFILVAYAVMSRVSFACI